MSFTTHPAPTSPATVPTTVRWSVAGWLAAVGAGVAEALVHLALPEPPSTGALAVRAGIYALVVVLVLALTTGRGAVRWTLAILLGGIGTLSLVVEPVSWLLAGGSPAAFLVDADGPTLLVAGLRAVHLMAVLVSLALMFTPASNAFFRSRRTARASGAVAAS